jgi:hypothetical protein
MKAREWYRVLLVLFFLVSANFSIGHAAIGDPPVPPGFKLLSSAEGVSFYKKDYTNGSPDFVQVADLSLGAQVGVLHGKIINSGSGEGVYGGDNARFSRLSIRQFWNQFASSNDGAFCVVNGQFFRLADSPTPLPFPLKQGGEILTDGYGIKEFPGQKLMLEIWPDHLDIRELSQKNLYSSTAPDIVAGLTEDAEKASKKAVGRTFVGIDDRDGDHQYETLLVFNTQIAKPPAAAEVLRNFGADKVMMLDGGGSTQLVCKDQTYINTDRLIPQALGIASGSLPPLAASLVAPTDVQIAVAGEKESYSITVRNRGAQTWKPADTQLLIDDGTNNRLRTSVSLLQEVSTGEKAEFSWNVPASIQGGFYQVGVSLAYRGELFPLETGQVKLLVLPADLKDSIPDLENKLVEWSALDENSFADQVRAWIDQRHQLTAGIGGGSDQLADNTISRANIIQPTVPQGSIQITDVIWIPVLMIPIVGIIILVIRKMQGFTDE